MASVEAIADGEIREVASEFSDGLELFKLAAEMASRPDSVFEQHRKLPGMDALRGVAESDCERGDAFLGSNVAETAGMKDQVLRADHIRALQLAAKRVDGFGADHRVA